MSAETPQIAIIYTRVSSLKQVKKGDGLSSQSARCREFAKQRGYEITEEFRDKGVSRSIANRPAIKEMLSYLRRHRAFSPVVLIDDISRLARGIEAHTLLRAKIAEAGGRLESPSIEFGEDSDSKLIENLLASVSQHGRQKNAEQSSPKRPSLPRCSRASQAVGSRAAQRSSAISMHMTCFQNPSAIASDIKRSPTCWVGSSTPDISVIRLGTCLCAKGIMNR